MVAGKKIAKAWDTWLVGKLRTTFFTTDFSCRMLTDDKFLMEEMLGVELP